MSNGEGEERQKWKENTHTKLIEKGGYWAVIACRLPYKEEKNINVEGISWR